MNIISKSPKSRSVTHLMKWMIACIFFVFFALIEYGIVLLCRFVFDYKLMPQNYARKELMQADIVCLISSSYHF